MKTAVLISGHMRSFERCLPTHYDHIYRHFDAPDFFVSTVRDEDSHTAELLRTRFPNSRVSIEVLDCQPEIPIPVPPTVADWQAGQERLYTHEPYAISVHPQAVLRQLWHLERVWDMFTPHHVTTNYDVIIRNRADNYFRSFRMPCVHPIIGTERERAHEFTPRVARTPWWGRFGGVNDRFAILGAEAAAAYFKTFSRVRDLIAKGYPLHPERLVYASLMEAGCTVDDTMRVEFAKLHWDHGPKHGSFRDYSEETTQADIAHLAAS